MVEAFYDEEERRRGPRARRPIFPAALPCLALPCDSTVVTAVANQRGSRRRREMSRFFANGARGLHTQRERGGRMAAKFARALTRSLATTPTTARHDGQIKHFANDCHGILRARAMPGRASESIYKIIKEESGGLGINEQNESKFMAPMP